MVTLYLCVVGATLSILAGLGESVPAHSKGVDGGVFRVLNHSRILYPPPVSTLETGISLGASKPAVVSHPLL